jgi:glycosyltransferase involved in cell wall biosynthesis
MNILILNWRDIKNEWAGGGEVYVFELAKRWVKMGHNVDLFCGQGIYKKFPEEEKIDGINIFRKGGRFSLYFWAFIYYFKKFRKKSDIIVDVQNGIPFFSVFYSRKPKVAVVYHVHGRQFFVELNFPFNVIGYFAEKYIFPIVYRWTKIIAISKTTKDDLIKLGFKEKNIDIVYCGINYKNGRLSEKFASPTILYLGRIKKYKRVDMLIKIMPEVLKRVPNARLLISGWGTEAATITDMSMRSLVRKRVKIVGPVSEQEKKELLSKSWVFVNPSIGEGWGIGVIEANLCGTPAVAFKVNGLRESIRHGETGFLAKDEGDLIDKICNLLKNETLLKKMGNNAKEWAKKFNWESSAEKSLKILEATR